MLENFCVILMAIFLFLTVYFAIKSYNTKATAEANEAMLKAEKDLISKEMFCNGVKTGEFKVVLMDSVTYEEFLDALMILQTACDDFGVTLDMVVDEEELEQKKREFNTSD